MRMKRFINMHTLLLLIFLILIGGTIYRISTWGERVDLDEINSVHHEDTLDVLDLILPVMDENGNILSTSTEVSTIVCFGNAPFADDRDSKDNLANMIAERTGATVYNCSIGSSYLAAGYHTLDPSAYPWDSYNFYWLTQVAAKADVYHRCEETAKILREAAAPEAQEVYDTLWNLDFETVDAVVIMYDASDYLASSNIYNDDNNTDIRCFTGNLEAGIEVLKGAYPSLRIIVMSPTYAFAVNEEDGSYVSSDIQAYGAGVLSDYVLKEYDSCFRQSVTFVDHLYGTVNEDNATDYLTDNLYLNLAGRKLVADRFVNALYYR